MPAPYILIFVLVFGLASPAWAGEVTRESGQDFEWTSTECVRPARPFIAEGSPQKQALMRDYALKVAYYIDCLKQEAQRDFDRSQIEMQEAIQDTLQKETDRLNDEVLRSARGR
ncbi:MAG: hypothetical protein AAF926_01575 [Pseudomonadota bacterium]